MAGNEIEAMIAALEDAPMGGSASPLGGVAPTGFRLADPGEEITREERRVVRYFRGHEKIPASLREGQVRKLQDKLVKAGLLDTEYLYGVWDETSEKAYETLLAYANAAGLDRDDALTAYSAGYRMEVDPVTGVPKRVSGRGGRTASVPPLKIRFTNPGDVLSVANDAAQKRIGREFTKEEAQRFLKAYQGEEGRAQKAAHGVDRSGGSFTGQESVASAAERFAESADPMAAISNRMLDYTDHMDKLLHKQVQTVAPKEI